MSEESSDDNTNNVVVSDDHYGSRHKKNKNDAFKSSPFWASPKQRLVGVLFVVLVAGIGTYFIISGHAAAAYGPITGIDSKCLDNYANQTVNFNKIELWKCNGGSNQTWNYDSANGTITGADGYCLDINGDKTRIGTIVDLYQCNGTQAQVWTVNTSAGTITSTQSGLCLSDKYNRTKNGNQIWMYTCNGSTGEQWSVTVTSTPPATVAPQITSGTSANFTESTAGNFTVTDTGNPTPTLSESGNLPTGVTFNTSSGVLSGTPTESGKYTLTFTASNGVSPNAVQSFTLTIASSTSTGSGSGSSGTGSGSGSSGSGSGSGSSGSGTVTYTTPPASLLPDSLFNQNVTGWAIDSNSGNVVSQVVTQANDYYPNCSGGVGGCIDWAVNLNRPVYFVSANVPLVSMSVASGCNDFTPSTGTEVPIPSNAVVGDSSDQILTVYQPSSNKVWEFWLAANNGGSWSACWGGEASMTNFSGVFPNPYGETASGISNLATEVTEADVASGSINHAVAMEVVGLNCDWDSHTSSGAVPPADRTDCGYNTANWPEEGMWFRFAPGTTCPATDCDTPFSQMVFNAGLKYGFIVVGLLMVVVERIQLLPPWVMKLPIRFCTICLGVTYN